MIAVEITRLVKDGGPLTKSIHPMPDGGVANVSSNCRMSRGAAHRTILPDWRDFAALIELTPRDTAYALGAIKPGLPDLLASSLNATHEARHRGSRHGARTRYSIARVRRPSSC